MDWPLPSRSTTAGADAGAAAVLGWAWAGAMAAHFKRHLQAGMVMVNAPTAGVDPHVPFGGRKSSSHGPREQGRYAAEFYTTVKTAYVAA